MIDAEEWRPVVGHEKAYEVSSLGRVRSLDRVIERAMGWKARHGELVVTKTIRGKILKPQRLDGRRYWTVTIGGRPRKIHHLVGAAFCGPKPEGHFWLHRNDDADNNRATNIRPGTRGDNVQDAKANGRFPLGSERRGAKLNERSAAAVLGLKGAVSQNELAAAIGVSASTIQAVHDRRTWKHVRAIPAPEGFAYLREIAV